MYQIAIGDDDPVFLKEAEALALKCLESEGLRRGVHFEIDCYSAAAPLLAALEGDKDRYQLVLLDVEFGKDNGLAVAASLREFQSGFRLIYITSHRDYVFDSFDTRPLHYLLKPVNKEKMSALIREDYRCQYSDARLYLKTGGRHISLAFQDIYAAEASQHRAFLHLKNGMEEWGGSLTELARSLPGWRFCRCHNSYYVNLSHVTELVRYEARLDNGQIIPVSKRFYKSVIEQYIAFLKN